MELTTQDFLQNFATQFEDTDPVTITLATNFKELEEWDSMMALTLIAMADEMYEVRLSGDDIRKSLTVEDLYNVVKSKLK